MEKRFFPSKITAINGIGGSVIFSFFLLQGFLIWLIIKVSGVSMLERTMINTKPGFEDYVKKTSPFILWFPKNN